MLNNLIKLLLKLNPSYYAFISGLLISPFIGLLGNASYSAPSNIFTFIVALIGGICFFFAGVLALAVSIELETINHLSFDEAPRFVNAHQAWDIIINTRITKLKLFLIGMAVLFIIGLVAQGYAVWANTSGYFSATNNVLHYCQLSNLRLLL